MRDIYTLMFKYYKLLPDTVAKQPPSLLFKVLDGLNDSEDEENIPDELKWFYGEGETSDKLKKRY